MHICKDESVKKRRQVVTTSRDKGWTHLKGFEGGVEEGGGLELDNTRRRKLGKGVCSCSGGTLTLHGIYVQE